MTKMHEMTNDVPTANHKAKHYWPVIRVNGRLKIDAFGRWWSPRELIVLLAVVVSVIAWMFKTR